MRVEEEPGRHAPQSFESNDVASGERDAEVGEARAVRPGGIFDRAVRVGAPGVFEDQTVRSERIAFDVDQLMSPAMPRGVGEAVAFVATFPSDGQGGGGIPGAAMQDKMLDAGVCPVGMGVAQGVDGNHGIHQRCQLSLFADENAVRELKVHLAMMP